MTLQDLVNDLFQIAMMVLAPCAVMAVKWMFDHLHIQATDQQRAVVYTAAETAVGLVLNAIRVRSLPVDNLTFTNLEVQKAAAYVLTHAADAAHALGLTQDSVAQMLVGKVSKALNESPDVPTVLPAPPPPPPSVANLSFGGGTVPAPKTS